MVYSVRSPEDRRLREYPSSLRDLNDLTRNPQGHGHIIDRWLPLAFSNVAYLVPGAFTEASTATDDRAAYYPRTMRAFAEGCVRPPAPPPPFRIRVPVEPT